MDGFNLPASLPDVWQVAALRRYRIFGRYELLQPTFRDRSLRSAFS